MEQLKQLYYMYPKPLIQFDNNVDCRFCGRTERCYSYNLDYFICHHAYQELCEYSNQMPLIHHLLSSYLVKDIVIVILSFMSNIHYFSDCIRLRRIEDDYLNVNLYELSKREVRLLFNQRRLYNPNSGTTSNWIKLLRDDQREKHMLWRSQYKK